MAHEITHAHVAVGTEHGNGEVEREAWNADHTVTLDAAELLTAIKTVDGAGSGLDADLLDGNSSAAFALASHSHDPLLLTSLLTITQDAANEGIIASTGYSLTGANAQNMLDLAGTWNTSGNPVALKIAITNTASGSTSKFASFLAGASGTTEVFTIYKDGGTVADYFCPSGASNPGSWAKIYSASGPTMTFRAYNQDVFGFSGQVAAFLLKSDIYLGWSASSSDPFNSGFFADTKLFRDGAANTLALRNGTAAQTHRIYNTWSDASNGEWMEMDWASSANRARLRVTKNGSGTDRDLEIIIANGKTMYLTAGALSGYIQGNERLTIDASGTPSLLVGVATPAAGSTTARLRLGSTAGFGIYFGSGAPTVSAAQGSLYLRSDGSSTSTRSYINTDGGTTWTAHTTAA